MTMTREAVATRAIPALSLRATIQPKSVDAEKRTFEVVWTTGERVLRGFWDSYWEELSLDPRHVRMGRLESGAAPLLNSHRGYDLSSVLGVVESARLEKKRGTAVVRFPSAGVDADADAIFRKIVDGIVRNVSVGYRVHRLEKVEDGEGKVPVMRATDWEPYEISLVPMGADAGAGVRSEGAETNPCTFVLEERSMAKKKTSASRTPTSSPATRADGAEGDDDQGEAPEIAPSDATRADKAEDDDEGAADEDAEADDDAGEDEADRGKAAKRAVAAERKRTAEILRIVRAMELGDKVAEQLIRSGASLDQARKQVIDLKAERKKEEPVGSIDGKQRIAVGDDLTRKGATDGLRNALMHRAAPHVHKLEDVGRVYRGMTLLEMARRHLEAHGVRTEGLGKRELAGLALGLETRGGMHSTSDFPLILADVGGKTLRAAYAEAPQTFQAWARRTSLPDFKSVKRTQLGEAPQLKKIVEGGEFTRGTVGEGREVYQLATYGRTFAVTRQTLINDDMDALSRMPEMFGRSARDLESDLVYEQLTSNPAMGDTKTLFHDDHHNTGTGFISVEAIGAGRAAMRTQVGLDGVQRINVQAKYLLVPAALETMADQFVSAAMLANEPGKVNPFAGRLQVIAEPRLDADDDEAWYLVADPGQIDTIEYAYLEGEEGPFMESRLGFDVDGLELKCRHDFAAKVIDWRGFYLSDGQDAES